MRFILALLAVLGLLAGGSVPAVVRAASGVVFAAESQGGGGGAPGGGQLDVNVDVDNGGWFADPVWIAIGAIALVALIVLIALAVRGRDTTIIKE